MSETAGKVVTTENLETFKTQMEAVIDKKVEAAGGGSTVYATEQDILDLFEDAGGETV